eukprot:5919578-Alexandrium_andersonii.AAC.1
MVRLAGEADCQRAARSLLLAGKLTVGGNDFKVVPDATWRSPGLLPVGVIPGQEAHRSALAA